MAKLILQYEDGKKIEYDTNNVLWQILEKKHIAEDMSDETWSNFVDDNSSEFADEASTLGREFVSNY